MSGIGNLAGAAADARSKAFDELSERLSIRDKLVWMADMSNSSEKQVRDEAVDLYFRLMAPQMINRRLTEWVVSRMKDVSPRRSKAKD